MMPQDKVIEFLRLNRVNVTDMTYNFLNELIGVARKCAEEDFKKYLLTLCEANGLIKKGGEE